MAIPDNAAKAREVRIIYEDDAAVISAPNQLAFFRLEFVFTKYTIRHVKNVNENGT
jgi:hypothetical protein